MGGERDHCTACAVATSRWPDRRDQELLTAAARLGITSLRSVRRRQLTYVAGPLDAADLDRLGKVLLADDLLHDLVWERPAVAAGTTVVEVALLPGVTDPAAAEVVRAAHALDLPVEAARTGVRFELTGDLTAAELERLAGKVLANTVIERWVVGTLEAAAVFDAATTTPPPPAVVPLRDLDAAGLAALDRDRALALDEAELVAVQGWFAAEGRDPTDAELETIAQTWSEHCSHKSFRARVHGASGGDGRPLLERLRTSTTTLAAPFVVSAFDGNAGIVDFGAAGKIAVKVETHNHPSAVEPFGGANTGVGGVLRDVMAAPARPIAVTDVLCFGPLDLPAGELPEGTLHPAQVYEGVVDGVADYGNKMGVPNVAGAVLHDPGYTANPLVFCGCVGAVPDDLSWLVGPQPGDHVLVLGGATGRDGIKGATFSSAGMDATTGEVAGASVQIGDPIVQKRVVDALEELHGDYHAITDCGAGGLSSAVGEMAEHLGVSVQLDAAPRKYAGLAAWEVWLSEAQERMVLAVGADQLALVAAACARHGVELADIGRFEATGRLVVRDGATAVVDLDLAFLHDGRPPRVLTAAALTPERTPSTHRPLTDGDLHSLLLRLLAHPTIASKAAVVHRYDHEVQGATVVRPLTGVADDGPSDGTVLASPRARAGVAIGVGVNPWYGARDPERMAEAVVDEAVRNVVAAGADPDAVALLDNFSWGDPKDPLTFAGLVAAVDGCTRAAARHRAPFVSGKDSLNNTYLDGTGGRRAVPPTLVVHAVAAVPDADATVTSDLKAPGNALVLVGARTVLSFGASHADLVLGTPGAPGGVPPVDDGAHERYRAVHRLICDGLVRAAHDVSEGGLAVAVAEMAIGGRLGATIVAPEHDDHDDHDGATDALALFGEGCGRLVLEVAPEDVPAVQDALGADVAVLGLVTAEPVVRLGSAVEVAVEDLRAAWQGPA